MARCCGSSGTCACKVEAGSGILVSGSGTSADPFVVTSTGGGGSGSDPEFIRDTIAASLIPGTGVTIAVDDPGNTITISSSASGGTDVEVVRDTIGAALVAGSNIGIVVDDPGNTITISATGFATSDADAFFNGTVYPLRATVTTDTTRRVRWIGPIGTPPTIGSGYAISGFDVWEVTP